MTAAAAVCAAGPCEAVGVVAGGSAVVVVGHAIVDRIQQITVNHVEPLAAGRATLAHR